VTNGIRAFLQQRIEVEKRNAAIVVGLVDEHGSRVVGCGKLKADANREVDGDTLFGIGSVTKTFTALLLQEMITRGELNLDDPVAKYLPQSVKLPARNGKEITLRQLVVHTSGLPANPNNLGPTWADYPTELLYSFLSGYKLRYDPGERYKYSNIGSSLLGHVIALKAGTNYESLLQERICQPLKMDHTRIVPGDGRSPVFYPQGGLSSTANDLLKYVAAQVELATTALAPSIARSHEVHTQPGVPAQNIGSWFVVSDPLGKQLVLHDGDAGAYSAFVIFDRKDQRGVVVLCSPGDAECVADIGRVLIRCEWRSDRRPKETEISHLDWSSFDGYYQRTGTNVASSGSGIGIRRQGNKIFAQALGSKSWPMRALLPGVEDALLFESDSRLFARMSGMVLNVSRDNSGKVANLTVQVGEPFSFRRISDNPPNAPELPRQPVAVRLDEKLLDACVGDYQFASNGMKLSIQRRDDQLVSQAWVEDDTDGPVDVYPESETRFFDKFGNRWTFVQNEKREVEFLILHGPNFPDWEGKKISSEPSNLLRDVKR
jgi:CubicO group peptidase (beta-lactamase class C family)